jgi:hypothetical protein
LNNFSGDTNLIFYDYALIPNDKQRLKSDLEMFAEIYDQEISKYPYATF